MATKNGRARIKQQEQSPPKVLLVGVERSAQRQEEFVPDIQLTLISVIKGAALAFLAANVRDSIEGGRIALEFFPIFITFLIICTFWYSALAGVTYLRWKLSLSDTLLYFALGLAENVMVQFTTNASWWVFFTGIFAILAGCTYWNDARQINESDYEAGNLYRQHVAERRIRAVAASIAGALNILAVYTIPQHLTWVYVLNLIVVCFILYSIQHSIARDVTTWSKRSS